MIGQETRTVFDIAALLFRGFWVLGWSVGVLIKLAVVAKWAVLGVGPFFLGHYGGFMAAHFLFVYYLFVRGISATGPEPAAASALLDLFVPLWPALLSLVVSHGISFARNFLKGREYVGRKVAEQMAEPYTEGDPAAPHDHFRRVGGHVAAEGAPVTVAVGPFWRFWPRPR